MHFEYADDLEKAEAPNPEADAKHARETVNRFLDRSRNAGTRDEKY